MGKHHGKNHLPGETPCLWRAEKPQNCTPKMPNVTSETHRKWCFWLLFPLAAAMNFSYLYIRSPNGKTQWKKSPPGGETPCLWRTEKPQNCTPKMPNVTSETHRKWCFWLLFLLLLLWILASFSSCYCRGFCCCCGWSPDGKTHLWETVPRQERSPASNNALCPRVPNVRAELVSKPPKNLGEFAASTKTQTAARARKQSGKLNETFAAKLPAAACCLLLPAAACCLLLPAAPCCCLLLVAAAAVVLLQSNSFQSKKQLLLLLLCPQKHGPPGRGNTMALKDEWSPK